jgi:hypothetical protein
MLPPATKLLEFADVKEIVEEFISLFSRNPLQDNLNFGQNKMRKRLLTVLLAKSKYNTEEVLKICELFIYGDIRYTTK